jgi:hypothetical protein
LGTNESDAKDVLQWVSLIAVEDNIEHVSEQMLERLLQDQKVHFQYTMFIIKLSMGNWKPEAKLQLFCLSLLFSDARSLFL